MKRLILLCAAILGIAPFVCPIESARAKSSLDSPETESYTAPVIEPFTFGDVGYSPWTDWQDVIPVHVNPPTIPEVQAGRIDWNSIAGQDRSYYPNRCPCYTWCQEIGIDTCGRYWNHDQFSEAIDALGKASLDISHSTALHNRWNRGSKYFLGDDPEIYVVDLVVREGSTAFEPFNPAEGMLNSVTVSYNWEIATSLSMYLNDEGFLCDAEGKGTGRTLITNWAGGSDFADENVDFRLTAQSCTGWQRNWMSGLSGLADWANTMGTGGSSLEIFTEALLCMLDPDECLYEPPDWGEYSLVSAEESDEDSVILTPEEYRSLLSPDGLLRIYTSKADYHELWYEKGDYFDGSVYSSRVLGSIAVEYDYTPSMPVVTIHRVVDELGHDLTALRALARTDLVVALEASFTNAGNVDPHTALVDWGDGTVDDLGAVTHEVNPEHKYANPGTYTTVLSVRDEYGNTGGTSVQIEVVYPSDYPLGETFHDGPAHFSLPVGTQVVGVDFLGTNDCRRWRVTNVSQKTVNEPAASQFGFYFPLPPAAPNSMYVLLVGVVEKDGSCQPMAEKGQAFHPTAEKEPEYRPIAEKDRVCHPVAATAAAVPVAVTPEDTRQKPGAVSVYVYHDVNEDGIWNWGEVAPPNMRGDHAWQWDYPCTHSASACEVAEIGLVGADIALRYCRGETRLGDLP